MKYTIIFCLFIAASNSYKEQEQNIDIQTQDFDLVKVKSSLRPVQSFEERQDSLRTVLINLKPNTFLKASLLKEFYIRGIVNQINEKIVFEFPFDLLGFDCGAPDCYSTDISFEFEIGKPFRFPEKINVKLYEHGCVDEEKLIHAQFELSEQSEDYVNYFSSRLKSNLIIKRDGGLYYYPHQKSHSVDVKTVEEKFLSYEFENVEIVPFQSTIMTTRFYDYAYFIKYGGR